MMTELLSGFIGALIASMVSILYLYISEKFKLRSEVALEVIGFCDEIYFRLQQLHYHKKATYEKESPLPRDEYKLHSQELTVLLTSTKTQAKVGVIYGESDIFFMFIELSIKFREVSSTLRKSTRSAWFQEDREIFNIFIEQIDPLRAELQSKLIRSTTVHGILSDLSRKSFPTLHKMFPKDT